MEEAQTEQNALDLRVLLVDLLLGEIGEGSLHVGLNAGRRLVGQLDRPVQNTDRHTSRWLSRKQQPEIDVRASSIAGERVEDLLEFDQPTRHEVDVLKHDPVALLVALLDSSPGDLVLTLAQRNTEERFSSLDPVSIAIALDDLFHLLNRIGTWGKNEEDGNLGL